MQFLLLFVVHNLLVGLLSKIGRASIAGNFVLLSKIAIRTHMSINISGEMGMAATRVAIATPSHLETRTRPQFIAGWTVATMSAQKFGVGR